MLRARVPLYLKILKQKLILVIVSDYSYWLKIAMFNYFSRVQYQFLPISIIFWKV